MKIYLLRHGQTMANITYTYAGITDSPLSDAGIEMLKKQREKGGYPDISELDVYTSGLTRTEQTLELLFGRVPHIKDPDFMEMNFGDFEGKTYDELKDTEAYQVWVTGDHMTKRCPGGENGNEMMERILRGIDRLIEKDRNALIVTHGGVIAMLFTHYFPDTGLNWYEIQPANGEGYVFEFEGDKAVSYSKIPV